LLAPEILQQLNHIGVRLAKEDETLKLMGMVGGLNAEHRSNIAHACHELKSRNLCSSSSTARIEKVCQVTVVQRAVYEIRQQTKVYNTSLLTGFVHLSTGVCLYKAEFVLQNFEAAAQHFRSALRTGWVEAYYYLGVLYKHGLGVTRCDITAKNYFQLGTNAGVPAAMIHLGDWYDEGIGVERDTERAVGLIRGAVARNAPGAFGILAWYSLHGHNMPANLPLAFRMAKKASEHGHALDTLALCYEQGIGVERDPNKAFSILIGSAKEAKHWLSGLALARCYKEGTGVEPSLEKMAAVYRKGTQYCGWKRHYYQGYLL